MCLPGNSRICLFCLIVCMSTWRPVFNKEIENGEDNLMYSKTSHEKHFHHHVDIQIAENSSQADQYHHIHHKGQYFYEELMDKYGENGILTFDGLKKMLRNIGVMDEEEDKHVEGKDHDHDNHEHSGKNHSGLHKHKRSANHIAARHEKQSHNQTDSSRNNSMCIYDSSDLLQTYGPIKSVPLTKDDLHDVCSGILVLLDKTSCPDEKESDHKHECEDDHHHGDKESDSQSSHNIDNIPAKVWGYSIAATLTISLVGLLGVAVIPIMQKVFYNHLLQFLVALAVGALSGDAMLHLFPHAFGGDTHEHGSSVAHGDESGFVMKGLCGLMAVYFFFMVERLLTIFTDAKRKKKKKKHSGKNAGGNLEQKGGLMKDEPKSPSEPDCESVMLRIHPSGKALENYAVESHKGECKLLMNKSHDDNNGAVSVDVQEEDGNDAVLDFGHGHSHSHCKSVPKSVSSIAWMVILGDGIHNFSDGLAIGVAFSNSVTGGISTSIAVFCHELPHEIGDFAVLLRAGMTVKQAIVYNCVSSVLGFAGMIIGIMIGNIGDASLWVFASIGGIFLYIAFVDMLPEMTAVGTRKGENPFCHLLLQISGMLLGAGIMFIIAMYENQIMTLIEP